MFLRRDIHHFYRTVLEVLLVTKVNLVRLRLLYSLRVEFVRTARLIRLVTCAAVDGGQMDILPHQFVGLVHTHPCWISIGRSADNQKLLGHVRGQGGLVHGLLG